MALRSGSKPATVVDERRASGLDAGGSGAVGGSVGARNGQADTSPRVETPEQFEARMEELAELFEIGLERIERRKREALEKEG